ncbi:hypothetical protein ATO6_15485 [Oceanicola sp. 22II-s10i]|uniref:hypothetical protein n=1 Tax=Oceanicola sp. 22II-s10i TaxID=1317116 RepID=UPI000B52210D|nr:hypothetical protein [Oceanicola sp. 22II-s10i]OWU83830.1 hypothetical protein ATO6_15485 [Oceanicola sp. 22II-s10i]
MIEIIAHTVTRCTVCAPAELTAAEVAAQLQAIQPPEAGHTWSVIEGERFRTGEANGAMVDCHNGMTRHWMLRWTPADPGTFAPREVIEVVIAGAPDPIQAADRIIDPCVGPSPDFHRALQRQGRSV